jgi:hypothetical protein
MSHTYVRHVFRDGVEVDCTEKTLSAADLYQQTSQIGRTAFLELINRWNLQGLVGVPNGGPVYVYIAKLELGNQT